MISPDIMGHFPTGDSECYFAASVMPTATIYVNYFNEVDYALGPLVWKSNIKPDLFKGYVYRKETGFECRGRHLNVETNGPDNYEIFAHVITHYSSPLGAMPIGMMFGSRGCFKRGLDLQGVLGFTADAHDHSGQFNRVFPFAWRYWRRVILDCHVDKDTPLARQ